MRVARQGQGHAALSGVELAALDHALQQFGMTEDLALRFDPPGLKL